MSVMMRTVRGVGYNVIYIDKDPSDPYKGWTWVEFTCDDVRKFAIPDDAPDTYKKAGRSPDRFKYPNRGNLPSRGRTGGKKFTLNIDGELIALKANKSLTIKALKAWLQTWVKSEGTTLITADGRSYPLDDGNSKKQICFVYFILNEDSNAIKIGKAKDVNKRLKTLQTSSPAELKLIKSVQTAGEAKALELEKSLHEEFQVIRLNGEWFRAEQNLLTYIENL
jgi:predicted GIY-YIG superfamily endonuclease